MSAPKSNKKKLSLTEREIEVFAKSWLCMKSQPEIDVDKLARLTKYGNSSSVRNLMTTIKKKIADCVDADKEEDFNIVPPSDEGEEKEKGAKPAAASRKRKPVTILDDDDDFEDEEETGTHPKRAKGHEKTPILIRNLTHVDDSNKEEESDFPDGW